MYWTISLVSCIVLGVNLLTKLSTKMKKLSVFIVALFLVSQGNISFVEAQTNMVTTPVNTPVLKTTSPIVDRTVSHPSQSVCPPGEKAVEEQDSNGNYFGIRCFAASVPVSGNSNTVSGNKYEEVYLPEVYSSSSNRNSKGDDTILPEKPIEVSSKNSNGSSFLINKNGNTYSVTESVKSTDEDKATDGATSASKSESIEMISSLPIKIKANSVTVVSGDVEKEVIKPSVAKEAVKDFSSNIDNDSIKKAELKLCEGSFCKSSTNVYEIKAEKKVKFLAVIPMRSAHVYTVDASTKEVVSEKAPWYSWMTW